ncbi:hypothetical protein ACQUSR_00080 [Streptomyces sp. P1-3]|uniref:hypothetical protein n=1 Tax=Streptomyces sp. P1-3 TaxID=3421658 RepID=UPI003D35D88B
MVAGRRGCDSDDWLTRAENTWLKPLCGMARGLRQDFDVVTAGLTLEWSSGKVEVTSRRSAIPRLCPARSLRPTSTQTPANRQGVTV